MINKSSIVIGTLVAAVVIAAFVLGFVLNKPSKNVAGERGGLQEFHDGVKAGDLNRFSVYKEMEVLNNEVKLWTNDTGFDAYVSGSILTDSDDIASSTFNISVFATTSSSVGTWADFGTLTEGARSLIDALTFATSSVASASTTSSVYAEVQAKGHAEILVPNGSSLFGFMKQNTTSGSIACAKAGACETATSSNRGIDPKFKLDILHRVKN